MAIANSDGSIVISTNLDTNPLLKALDKLKSKFASLKEQKTTFESITEAMRLQKQIIDDLNKKYNSLYLEEGPTERVKALGNEIKKETSSLKELENIASSMGKKSTKSFNDMSNGLKKFGKRIAGIIKSALIFSVLYKVMQAVVKLFQNILMSDEKFRQDWEELKAAFYTAAYPIINLIVPAIKWIVQQVRDWSVSIGKVAAALQGMSYSELVEQAKASKEAADNYADMEKSSKKTADNVKKQLASFDDIEILSSGSEEEQGAGLTGFEGLGQYDTSGEKSMLADLMTAIGGALAAVGLILLFKGQITWGIGFLVAGAAFWAIGEFANGEFSTDPIANTLIKIMGIAGTALLALGIILCVFGVINPVSISMIAAGAVLLVSAIAISNDAIVEAIKGPIGAIMAIVGAAVLALGIILVCCGVIPLGIGLIVAGAVSLVTPIAINANAIVDWIKGVWDAVKAFWNNNIAPVFTARFWLDLAKDCGNGLIAGFEAAINGIIIMFENMLNFVTDGINKISFDIPDWLGGGHFGFNLPRLTLGRVSLPRLARGTVVPPNKEFMAVLGDNTKEHEIVSPISTMKQAFMEAMVEMGGSGQATKEEHYYLNETELMSIVYKLFKGGERINGASLVDGGM